MEHLQDESKRDDQGNNSIEEGEKKSGERKQRERRKLGEREKERELFMAITKVSERDAQRTSSVLILSSFPPSLEVSLTSIFFLSLIFLLSYFSLLSPSLTIFLLCQLRIQSLHPQVNTREEEEK